MEQILLEIKNTAVDELSVERYVNQLHVLVQLRKFEIDIQEIMDAMGNFIKLERDPFYNKGLQTATERERAKADKRMKEMARKMLSAKEPLEKIMDYTGLSLDEIKAL